MSRVEIKIEEPGDAEEIEVVEVFVQPGSTVREGDPVVELATDKANQEIRSPKEGTIIEVLVAEFDVITADQVLAVLETSA
jgi:pyruvate/2-oxoglutarate dehydrogenase complex dihydrolipoamide acyltransferase (E2) component